MKRGGGLRCYAAAAGGRVREGGRAAAALTPGCTVAWVPVASWEVCSSATSACIRRLRNEVLAVASEAGPRVVRIAMHSRNRDVTGCEVETPQGEQQLLKVTQSSGGHCAIGNGLSHLAHSDKSSGTSIGDYCPALHVLSRPSLALCSRSSPFETRHHGEHSAGACAGNALG